MPFHTAPTNLEQAACGFTSPAADHTEGALDLLRLVVRKPAATFYMRVVGGCMAGAGIGDGDLLVVDRSLTPREGDVVIAVIGDQSVVRLMIGSMVVALTKPRRL